MTRVPFRVLWALAGAALASACGSEVTEPTVELGARCGTVTCGATEYCCNAACGQCVAEEVACVDACPDDSTE